MTIKKYHQIKQGILIFLLIIFCLSVFLKIYFLSVISVLSAILFIALFHSSQELSDEREVAVRRQAVDFTFTILVSTLAFSSFIMLLPLSTGWSVFSKGNIYILNQSELFLLI